MSLIGIGVDLLFLFFLSYLKNGICFCCIFLIDNWKCIFSLYVLLGYCVCWMIFNIEYLFIVLNVFKFFFKSKINIDIVVFFCKYGGKFNVLDKVYF